MRDFFAFRSMMIPFFIHLFFWVGVLACLATAVLDMIHGAYQLGLLVLIVGPILVRLFCEVFIVLFRINSTLTQIYHELHDYREAVHQPE